jgi:hypothetical protein
MRSLLATLVLVTGLAGSAAWADDAVTPADQAAIERVIGDQIEAFRHDDGEKAFGFAAPGTQHIFQDPGNFLAMVHRGYGVLVRPQSVIFGSLTSQNGQTLQQVQVVGADGTAAVAVYDMEHEADGSWRISGCSLLKSPLLQS